MLSASASPSEEFDSSSLKRIVNDGIWMKFLHFTGIVSPKASQEFIWCGESQLLLGAFNPFDEYLVEAHFKACLSAFERRKTHNYMEFTSATPGLEFYMENSYKRVYNGGILMKFMRDIGIVPSIPSHAIWCPESEYVFGPFDESDEELFDAHFKVCQLAFVNRKMLGSASDRILSVKPSQSLTRQSEPANSHVFVNHSDDLLEKDSLGIEPINESKDLYEEHFKMCESAFKHRNWAELIDSSKTDLENLSMVEFCIKQLKEKPLYANEIPVPKLFTVLHKCVKENFKSCRSNITNLKWTDLIEPLLSELEYIESWIDFFNEKIVSWISHVCSEAFVLLENVDAAVCEQLNYLEEEVDPVLFVCCSLALIFGWMIYTFFF
jgi:hypothetical protein